MPVQEQNKEYNQNLYKWQLVRDVCEGSRAVKSARAIDPEIATNFMGEEGTLYLPPPNPEDLSQSNRLRYRSYKMRASFVNFTAHTKDALVGMVFRKDTIINLPPGIDEIKMNANGRGDSLETMLKRSLDEVTMTGREGLLVDFPPVPPGATRADIGDIYPTITKYNAESIINWRYDVIGGRTKLSMVVLKEEKKHFEDEFSFSCEPQYRVLLLDDIGRYVQRLYDSDGKLLGYMDSEKNFIGETIPLDSQGSPFSEIQFFFLGSVNNDAKPDKSLIYDLAEVNIAHYRNSADYEESCFFVGQPTPVLAGLTQAWVEDMLKGQVELGSRAAIPLPEGGSATLLQAAPNSMPKEGMEMKEKQMVQIGAKIISDGGGVETAEAAKIRFAGQNSKLGTAVKNIEEGYKKALQSVMAFAGAQGEIELELNTEFYDKTIDPQLLMAKIQLMDRGVIASDDVRNHLRKLGEISEDRTNEEIDNEVGEMAPFETSGTSF